MLTENSSDQNLSVISGGRFCFKKYLTEFESFWTSEDKIIVTISGKDGVGIVAEIASVLAKYEVNIEDIRQTIMQGCFMMFLLGDISKSKYSFKEIKEAVTASGQKLGMEIWMQKKEIFILRILMEHY